MRNRAIGILKYSDENGPRCSIYLLVRSFKRHNWPLMVCWYKLLVGTVSVVKDMVINICQTACSSIQPQQNEIVLLLLMFNIGENQLYSKVNCFIYKRENNSIIGILSILKKKMSKSMTLILQVTEPLFLLCWPRDSDECRKMTRRLTDFDHVLWEHSRTLPLKGRKDVQNALQVIELIGLDFC